MLIAMTLMDSLHGSADFVYFSRPPSLSGWRYCESHIQPFALEQFFYFYEELFYLSAVHPVTYFVQQRYNAYCKDAASKPAVVGTSNSGFEVERER